MDVLEETHTEVAVAAEAVGINDTGVGKLLRPSVAVAGATTVYVGDEPTEVPWWRYGHGPANRSGGFRFTPEGTADHTRAMSLWMRFKRATVVPIRGEFETLLLGGGKGEAAVDVYAPGFDRLARLQLGTDIGRKLAKVTGPELATLAPDVSTTWFDMEAMARGAALGGNPSPGAIAGRRVSEHYGSEAREPATAWGGSDAIIAVARQFDLDLSAASAALVGFGNVGGFLYREMTELLRFPWVSDRDHAIRLHPNAQGLHAWCQDSGTLADFEPKTAVTHDEVLEADVDFLVLAGVGESIGEQNADRIRARYVICLQNGGISPAGAAILASRGITVLSDWVVSAAGTMVSSLEVRYGPRLDVLVARDLVRRSMTSSVQRTLAASEQWGVPPRDAALRIALIRIADDGQLGRQRLRLSLPG